MSRFLAIVLALLVVTVVVNDTVRFTTAQRTLNETSEKITQWASVNARSMTRTQAAAQMVVMAAPSNVTLYQYGQTDTGVQVWTEIEVPSTMVTGTVYHLLVGDSFSEATTLPFKIRTYQEASFK